MAGGKVSNKGPCKRCSFPLNIRDYESFYSISNDFDNVTALMCAAFKNHYNCLKSYLQAGADVNETNSNGLTALHIVRKSKCMALLLKSGSDVNKNTTKGSTPLHSPMNSKCVELLLKAGSDVNKTTNFGSTPLHSARNWKCVQLLLEAGANANAKTNSGSTPLHCAFWPTTFTDIHPKSFMCLCTKHKMLELLIKAGADVNAANENGSPPLNGTVSERCAEVLVKAGADVNWKDRDGVPLIMRTMYPTLVKIFIDAGADVNAVVSKGQRKGQTVLFNTNAQFLKIYLKAGVFINRTDCMGKNALQDALQKRKKMNSGDLEYIMLLFVSGERLGPKFPKKKVPACLKHEDVKLRLDHMCREAIRKHLVDLEPCKHLFNRIPLLPIPASVTEYLLYNHSLDEPNDSDDEDVEPEHEVDDDED